MAAQKEDPIDDDNEKNDSKKKAPASPRKNRKRSLQVMYDKEEETVSPATKKRKLNVDDTKQSENEDTSNLPAETFKICCYNLNGVRASAKKGLEEYIEQGTYHCIL